MTLTMTIAEREDFLAGLHGAVLSVDDPGHGPLTVPVNWLASPEKSPARSCNDGTWTSPVSTPCF